MKKMYIAYIKTLSAVLYAKADPRKTVVEMAASAIFA